MKKRHVIRCVVLAGLIALALTALSLRDSRSRPAEAAVNHIQYSLGCSPNGRASVAFYWYGTSPSARQVWLDVSTTLGYWDPGTFTGAGPFKATDSMYFWDGLASATTYYVRVNQQLPNGAWDPSETYSITTENCYR